MSSSPATAVGPAGLRAEIREIWETVAPAWGAHADYIDAWAALVAPGGEVVLSDVSEHMVRIAAARASARGVTNVRVRRLDAEDIDEPDGSFDAVLCREGLMFAV